VQNHDIIFIWSGIGQPAPFMELFWIIVYDTFNSPNSLAGI
jgi:hypothetical protein